MPNTSGVGVAVVLMSSVPPIIVTALPVMSTVIELPAANAYRKQSLPAPAGAGGETMPGVQAPP